MPDSPDLAALALAHDPLYLRALRSAAEAIRRDAEAATSPRAPVGRSSALMVADTIPEYLAVLSLVDDLRAENERLREYVDANEAWMDAVNDLSHDGTARLRFVRARRAALAGSPAENKEPTDPYRDWCFAVELRGETIVVSVKAPRQSVWREVLTVERGELAP